MSDQTTSKPKAPTKEAPEALQLRARPSLVARLDRRVIATLAGTTCALLCGAAIYALDPPGWASEADAGPELYNVDRKPLADGLNAMPARYDQVEPPPELGPPLPGDLGKAWHDAQAGNLGLQGPDPEAERRRQEELRRQQELAEARASGLFFQLDTERGGGRQNGGRAAPLPDMPDLAGLDPARLAQVGVGSVPGPGDRRLAFLDQGQDASIYSAHGLQTPASPYQVMAGTIIPATMITGINSDLPGQIIAQVTENVYDTVTGQHLLIPQGARMLGTYDSGIGYAQERVLLIWTRLINPDGSSIQLDNLAGTDVAGYAGLEDQVDFHTWRLLKGVALATVLGVGAELAAGDENDRLIGAGRDAAFESANQVGQEITRRNLDVAPTITIRPGFPVRIIVSKDIVLQPYQG